MKKQLLKGLAWNYVECKELIRLSEDIKSVADLISLGETNDRDALVAAMLEDEAGFLDVAARICASDLLGVDYLNRILSVGDLLGPEDKNVVFIAVEEHIIAGIREFEKVIRERIDGAVGDIEEKSTQDANESQ